MYINNSSGTTDTGPPASVKSPNNVQIGCIQATFPVTSKRYSWILVVLSSAGYLADFRLMADLQKRRWLCLSYRSLYWPLWLSPIQPSNVLGYHEQCLNAHLYSAGISNQSSLSRTTYKQKRIYYVIGRDNSNINAHKCVSKPIPFRSFYLFQYYWLTWTSGKSSLRSAFAFSQQQIETNSFLAAPPGRRWTSSRCSFRPHNSRLRKGCPVSPSILHLIGALGVLTLQAAAIFNLWQRHCAWV